MTYANITNNIVALREEAGLSQADVAGKIGLTRSTYTNIELGKRDPRITELRELARLYEVTLEHLLGDLSETTKEAVPLEANDSTVTENSTQANEGMIEIPVENQEAFKQVLLYVLEKVGAKPNVGETVLYKLLYFIDFDYFEKYQEQLTGARYIRNHYGPTPVSFAQVVEDMKEQDELDITSGEYFKYKQRKYMPRKKADLRSISAQQLEHIDEVLNRLSDKTATELSELSHKDVPWIATNEGQPIDYMSVFYRGKETSVRDHSKDEL